MFIKEKLEKLLAFFIAHFPRALTRTELVKLVFLFEQKHFESFGKSYCGIEFIRDYFGPNCPEIVPVLSLLEDKSFIAINSEPNMMGGITYFHRWRGSFSPELEPEAIRIAYYIIYITADLDLPRIKELAYSTPSMQRILAMENEQGCNMHGEVIRMIKKREDVKKRPISRLKAAFKTINRESRGTDEEYIKTILREHSALKIYRERAERWIQ